MAIAKKFLVLMSGTALVAGCMGQDVGDAGSASVPGDPNIASNAPRPITDEEKAQGAELHPKILQEFGGKWQSPQTGYVVSVGKEIAVESGLGNAESAFEVSLLNSSVNNAFAIPGGYIYITRQLVALCNSEAEMAGVLGHEVGHVAARHSKKRQKRAGLANILGVGGTILGAILGDRGGLLGALGGGLQQYSGQLAQLFTLSYSRAQEEEADDLGIRYLSNAGYDPDALSDMLASLALQSSVDTRAAGKTAQAVPEWARTHPEPAKRVARAAKVANAYPDAVKRNRDRHLSVIDGMLYGDDPKQGIIEGRTFSHPDLKLKFTVPNGFGMSNGSQAVTINGNSGQAIFTTQKYTGDKKAYIDAAFKAVAGKDQSVNYGEIRQTTVNGLPAFYASTTVAGQNNSRNVVTVYAYEFSNSQAFHFVTVHASGRDPFGSMRQSVSRLSNSQAASIKPRKIDIVTVKSGDTVSKLASRMAYESMKTERFMALNGMLASDTLRAGSKVKIVTY